jgi:hypothetical protein
VHCSGCGNLRPDDGSPGAGHEVCDRRRAYEPPRFCVECGRRMVVKVMPTSYVATCSVHGDVRPV